MEFETIQLGSAFDENFKSLQATGSLALPNAGGHISQGFYDTAKGTVATGTLAGVAGRVDMVPFATSKDVRIDQLGVAVSAFVASAAGRVFVYDTNSDGWPDKLLYVSGDLDFGQNGFKGANVDFTFVRGRQYWVGVWHSSTATVRATPLADCYSLGLDGADGTTYFTRLSRTVSFSGSLPANWGFLASDRVANLAVPSIRYRVAGLPVNTVAPAVTGTAIVDSTLTTTNGTWIAGFTFTYQWRRDEQPIAGATASTYTLVGADEEAEIDCVVTAVNFSGSATQASNKTAAVTA